MSTTNPTDLQREAAEFARAYTGSFGFMRQMHRAARDPSWIPTPGQAVAILRCRSYEPLPSEQAANRPGRKKGRRR